MEARVKRLHEALGRVAKTRKRHRLAAEEVADRAPRAPRCSKAQHRLASLAAAQRFKPQPLLVNKLKFSVVLRTVSSVPCCVEVHLEG
jgi:hypothetical protein